MIAKVEKDYDDNGYSLFFCSSLTVSKKFYTIVIDRKSIIDKKYENEKQRGR